MSKVVATPPRSQLEPVTEVLHGVKVIDPYRWLEERESLRTRDWLRIQQEYARLYLDQLPGRAPIRERIRELLDSETYDSPHRIGDKYFFRKRVPGQEQPGIFCREGLDGEDRLLLDPAQFGSGKYSAVNLVRVSPDGRLVAYELKEGGERSGRLGFIEVQSRNILADVFPRGYLRGLVFVADSRSVLYVHESVEPGARDGGSAYLHVFGTSLEEDEPIFLVRDGEPSRLVIVPGREQVGFMLFRFRDKGQMDFYLWALHKGGPPDLVLRDIEYSFRPLLMNDGRVLAMTDLEAPNFRIVEVRFRKGQPPQFVDLVPANDATIQRWTVTEDRILVSYVRDLSTAVDIFDSAGRPLGQLPVERGESIRLVAGSYGEEEVFFERESFTSPIQIWRYSPAKSETSCWAERRIPFRSQDFEHTRVWFTAQSCTTASPMPLPPG